MDTVPSGFPSGSTEKPVPFGPYMLLRLLGKGGMGRAYLAERVGPGDFRRMVCVKVLLNENTEDKQFVSWFFDEAAIHGRLHHENIVAVHDFGEHEGQYFLVLEYVEGTDLRNLMHRLEDAGLLLPVDLVVSIGYELAAALKHAHELDIDGVSQNLVHRDLSPANVLLSLQGHAKLGDFGVVKATTRVSRTETGGVKGKIHYMSPEQLSAAQLDGRSDLFALGAILFELLSGQHPFRLTPGDPDVLIMQRILKGERPVLGKIAPHVPPELCVTVEQLLATRVEDRVSNAEVLMDILEPMTRGAAARQLSKYVAASRENLDFPSTAIRSPVTRPKSSRTSGPQDLTHTLSEVVRKDGDEAAPGKAPRAPRVPSWTRWAVLAFAVVVAALLAVRTGAPSDSAAESAKGGFDRNAQTEPANNPRPPPSTSLKPSDSAPSSSNVPTSLIVSAGSAGKAGSDEAAQGAAPFEVAEPKDKEDESSPNAATAPVESKKRQPRNEVADEERSSLRAGRATLRVVVLPFGSAEVDGKRGPAPLALELASGTHKIRAGRTSALVREQTVRLKPGEHREVVIELADGE